MHTCCSSFIYITVIDHIKKGKEKPGRVVVSVSADTTQQEALLWLKNLKVLCCIVFPKI